MSVYQNTIAGYRELPQRAGVVTYVSPRSDWGFCIDQDTLSAVFFHITKHASVQYDHETDRLWLLPQDGSVCPCGFPEKGSSIRFISSMRALPGQKRPAVLGWISSNEYVIIRTFVTNLGIPLQQERFPVFLR